MSGRLIVIAGTGTSVGKTHFAEALLRAWRRTACVVGLKPVESGVADPSDTDAARLASVSSFHVKQCAYPLSAPLSPHLAARDQGVEIRQDVVQELVRQARQLAAGVVVELAGGLFTPLADGLSNAELAAGLAADVLLLVAPDRLGVLHDVAATVRAASAISLRVHGVILVTPEKGDASTGRNAAEIVRITGVPIAASLPRAPSTELANLPSVQRIVDVIGTQAVSIC